MAYLLYIKQYIKGKLKSDMIECVGARSDEQSENYTNDQEEIRNGY